MTTLVEVLAEVALSVEVEDPDDRDEAVQAMQDAIGHTGAVVESVIEVTVQS